MKKVLAWVLLLTLVLGVFAGCKKQDADVTEPPYQGAGAADAIEYLKGFYTDSGKQTPVDFTRFGIVRVGGVAFDVVWTTDVSEDLVKIVVNEDGTVTIDINEECEADTEYTLTATITDAQGNTVSHSWTYILPEGVDMVEVVKAAYALAPGESLPYESRLIGKIVSIDTIWSDEFQNITVTIAVEGVEDMPIKCYRMKANDSTIDQIPDLKVGNIITVCGTIKNYEGTIEFDAGCILEKVEKGDAVDAPTDPGQILKEAYALPQDTALPYQATLTGTVTEIDTPYDPQYSNISVVITVEGYENMPMLCYRLKGTDVEKIAIGDLITVTGIIKNYRGTIEYDAGCIMTDRVSGGGVAQGPSSDPNKIIPDALALGVGEKLPYRATLTGEVYSVDTPYDPNYGNVTVTIKVNGVKFQCYRMVGDGIDQIRESDTITVSGTIENYNGKLEFSAKCTLDNWVMGPRAVNYGPLVEETAYRLYVEQTGIGKTLYFTGDYSGSRLSTSTKGSEGVDVFVERVSGQGVRFYFMDGETKSYIGVEDYTNDSGQIRGRACVTTTPGICWAYNADLGVYLAEVGAGKHFLGAYSTYETISASWVGYIDGTYGSGGQYVAKFMKASDVPADGPSQGGTTVVQGTPVENPVVGTAYKFGYQQNQVEGKPFLGFAGDMAGFYYATSDKIDEMVDVYLEEADGGYHLYSMIGGTKTYLDVVPRDDEPTKVNVVLQTSGEHTVYSLNTEYNYVYTEEVNAEWYLGTYGTNKSISASKTSYISDTTTIGVSQFCAWFCEVEEVEVEPEEPSEPVVEGETAKVVFYAPELSTALTTVDSAKTYGYLPKTDFTITENGDTVEVSGLVETNVFTMIAADETGDIVYLMDCYGRYMYMKDTYDSFNFSTELPASGAEWGANIVDQDAGLFYLYNIEKNKAIGYDTQYSNFGAYADASKQTVLSMILIMDEEPEESEPNVSEPAGDGYNKVTSADQFTSGEYVMIVDTGYAPGAVDGTWLTAVQPTVSGNSVTDTKGAVWTLTVNGDSVTIADANGNLIGPKGGNNNGLTSGSYDWAWSFKNGKFIFAGTGEDTVYLASNASTTGEFPGNNRFRGYKTTTCSGNPSTYPYEFTLYKLGGEYVEPEVTEPEETVPSAEAAIVTNPVAGTAYKMGMDKGDGKVLYFTGNPESAEKTYRLESSDDVSKAVDVYLEEANGGYRLYFMKDDVKTYIRVFHYTDGDPGYGKGSLEFVTSAPSEVMTYDETANTLVYDYDGNNAYYMGTYGSYFTFSVSNTSFITGDKASTVDASQFPARFYTVSENEEPEETEPEETEPEETEPSTGAESVTYTFSNYGVGTQYTDGETYELDATTSLYLVGGHMNTQLRLYDDAKGDAQAIFTCAKNITSVVINAGHRAAALNVYASVDGQNWVLISELATQTSFGDFTVEIPAGYKYLKLDAVGAQIRVPYMIFSFEE